MKIKIPSPLEGEGRAGALENGADLSQTHGLIRQQLAAAEPPVDSCRSRYRDENAGAPIGQ